MDLAADGDGAKQQTSLPSQVWFVGKTNKKSRPWALLACAPSLWPGFWTLRHLLSAFPSSIETKRIEIVDQLYVGK
jgi:hypothetical protein